MPCCVAYLRTSSATNVGGDSDTRQRTAITSYAAAAGYTVEHEFYDTAISGSDPLDQRDGFVAMLAWCREHACRVILVETASRFARDLLVQEMGLAMLRREGFTLIAADKPDTFTDSTDPMTKAFRQMIGVMTELDKALTVAKLRGARDRKSLAAGRRIEGRKGYATTSPALMAVIRQYRDEGLSQRQIASKLAETGFTNGQGRPFNPGHISKLLRAA